MKKSTTLALAGLMAVTAGANASMSRWNGFGNANAFIADVQDIWTLPGVVAGNKNAVYYEFGAAPAAAGTGQNRPQAQSWGGVHSELGPGVLGIWINRGTNGSLVGTLFTDAVFNFGPSFATAAQLDTLLGNGTGTLANNQISNFSSAANAGAAPASSGRVDILYGFSVNDKLDLGISLSRGNRNAKTETAAPTSTTNSFDAGALGFGLGAEIKELAFIKLLEIGLIFESESYAISAKSNAGENKFSASSSGFGLRVGADIAGDDGKFSRAEINFASGGGSAKDEPLPPAPAVGNIERKLNGMNWNLGYAMGGTKDKGMGLMGLRLLGSSSATETDAPGSKIENSSLALELSVAGEGKIKEWLTARAGMHGNLYQSGGRKTNPAVSAVTTSTSNNGTATFSTGLSATFGDVVIDGVLNQDVLYTGGWFLSGIAETVFTQVSATWAW